MQHKQRGYESSARTCRLVAAANRRQSRNTIQPVRTLDLIKSGRSVLLIDSFQTGSATAPRDRAHKFFTTFNRTDDANRVQDILTALAFLSSRKAGTIELCGTDEASTWVAA